MADPHYINQNETPQIHTRVWGSVRPLLGPHPPACIPLPIWASPFKVSPELVWPCPGSQWPSTRLTGQDWHMSFPAACPFSQHFPTVLFQNSSLCVVLISLSVGVTHWTVKSSRSENMFIYLCFPSSAGHGARLE